jgi:hypothetical protein
LGRGKGEFTTTRPHHPATLLGACRWLRNPRSRSAMSSSGLATRATSSSSARHPQRARGIRPMTSCRGCPAKKPTRRFLGTNRGGWIQSCRAGPRRASGRPSGGRPSSTGPAPRSGFETGFWGKLTTRGLGYRPSRADFAEGPGSARTPSAVTRVHLRRSFRALRSGSGARATREWRPYLGLRADTVLPHLAGRVGPSVAGTTGRPRGRSGCSAGRRVDLRSVESRRVGILVSGDTRALRLSSACCRRLGFEAGLCIPTSSLLAWFRTGRGTNSTRTKSKRILLTRSEANFQPGRPCRSSAPSNSRGLARVRSKPFIVSKRPRRRERALSAILKPRISGVLASIA